MSKEDLIKAIRCCREDDCENCPMLSEICDNLRVDMEDLPVDLVDQLIDVLEAK